MARYYRRGHTNWGFIVVVSALVAAVVLISLADKVDFGGKIPTWNKIFAGAGLAEPAYTEESDKNESTTVHFIDVGQGDSILIKTPDKNILIDAGTTESAGTVVSYLQSQNVTQLDYLIATHPHSDHIGGMSYVINKFDIKNIIAPLIPDEAIPASQSYFNMLKAIENKGLTITAAKAGAQYDIGAGAGFTIVGPINTDSENINNNSVVIRFSYGEVSFLFTGDSERAEEDDILASGANIRADVLKLGHHGSSTSSGFDWLDTISPLYAVVSCGIDNGYGHPHTEVSSRLDELSVETYRTDLEGTIVFKTDGVHLSLVGSDALPKQNESTGDIKSTLEGFVKKLGDELASTAKAA